MLAVRAFISVFVRVAAVSWYLALKKQTSGALCEAPCIWQGAQTDRLGYMGAISALG